jgi:heat shock protein HslJ
MRRGSLLALATLTALGAFGCSDDDSDSTPTLGRLAGMTFESTDVAGHDMVAGTSVTLTFDDDGLAVNAGCNTLFGGVTIDDGTLVVGTMAQTQMACTEDLMAQDALLVSFLEGGPSVRLDGKTLTLAGTDVTITAEVVS